MTLSVGRVPPSSSSEHLLKKPPPQFPHAPLHLMLNTEEYHLKDKSPRSQLNVDFQRTTDIMSQKIVLFETTTVRTPDTKLRYTVFTFVPLLTDLLFTV
jgi:hypothetical protein